MNPKDVLIQQLRTIALLCGAGKVQLLYSPINEMLGEIAIDSVDDPLILSDIPEKLVPEIACGTLTWHQPQTNELLLGVVSTSQKNNIPLFETTEQNGALGNSRRSPIVKHLAPQYMYVQLGFEKALPDWLNPTDFQSPSHNNLMCTLQQSLFSCLVQVQLQMDYLSLMSDPLTKLCSRSVLLSKLTRLGKGHSIGLVMLHCIDFQHINKKFGHDYGDLVIREIAAQLKSITREDDILCRFGGALFGVAFPTNETTDVANLAKKLQQILQQNQFLDGAINLFFDIGAALVDHSESFKSDVDRASSLINRCDQALKVAQQEHQPSIITWQKDDFNLYQQEFNYLGGIFTADTVTDYRNMLLLWDISSLIADKLDFQNLLQSVVQRLAQTFDFICSGLISDDSEDDAQFMFTIDQEDNAVPLSQRDRSFIPEVKQMQQVVFEQHKPSERYFGQARILALPLEAESRDCFVICGHSERFTVTHDTKVLLSGLTRQLGKALKRSRLEEELNRKLEHENAQLQTELAQLKSGLQVSTIVYQSEAMHNLMRHAKRAAMTDTTVLVSGESGTGKERLIHALHQMGNRSDKPLVIVDCGSIPETLIESELFGHIKGAFTGAQNTVVGKVQEADGGVLVLDEIGELPLQMQTKLLRFVQEKHFTPVGSSKVIDVDVKIIAVTNRDLATEVELGTFRKDLYYRLNVLTLHNPPLRARSEDIGLLSAHFLAKFSEQFGVTKKGLSLEALNKMQGYNWPGNIRELENRLMQATLMCEGDTIDWPLLNIPQEQQDIPPSKAVEQVAPSTQVANVHGPSSSNHESLQHTLATEHHADSMKPVEPVFSDEQSYLQYLGQVLLDVLPAAAQKPQFFHASFGLWIEDDLIMKTYLATDRKMRLTATRLCISQSTARRKVDKILADSDFVRPDNWQGITEALLPVARGDVPIYDCFARIRLVVLQAILQSPMYSMAHAAQMMGVSEPTLYKLRRELDSQTSVTRP